MKTSLTAMLLLFGLFYAETNAQWTSTQGPYGGVVRKIAVSGQTMYAALDSAGIFKSTASGAAWNAMNTGLTNHDVWSVCINGSSVYAGTNGAGVYVSTNNGGSWTQANFGITGTLFIHSLILSGSYVMAAAPSGAFRTSDGGATWTKVTTGLTNVDVMAFATSGPNLFAGTLSGVFLSTDYGSNWTPAKTGLTANIVFALATAGSNLYGATTPSGLFLSTNNGTNWSSVASNLGTMVVHCLASSGTNVFAGTDSGVYLSSNNGTYWLHVNSGLPTKAQVHSLTVTSTYILAGTDSFGVWQRPISELVTSVEEPSTGMTTEFRLEQNYPNPFNPTTKLRYVVGRVVAPSPERSRGVEGPAALHVKLAVYDLLGREVAVLVDEAQQPGSYEVRFDGGKLASGVYLYQLRVGEFSETRKFILMR